jgi:hypothetical protein
MSRTFSIFIFTVYRIHFQIKTVVQPLPLLAFSVSIRFLIRILGLIALRLNLNPALRPSVALKIQIITSNSSGIPNRTAARFQPFDAELLWVLSAPIHRSNIGTKDPQRKNPGLHRGFQIFQIQKLSFQRLSTSNDLEDLSSDSCLTSFVVIQFQFFYQIASVVSSLVHSGHTCSMFRSI